jgi:hypothetical protein
MPPFTPKQRDMEQERNWRQQQYRQDALERKQALLSQRVADLTDALRELVPLAADTMTASHGTGNFADNLRAAIEKGQAVLAEQPAEAPNA